MIDGSISFLEQPAAESGYEFATEFSHSAKWC